MLSPRPDPGWGPCGGLFGPFPISGVEDTIAYFITFDNVELVGFLLIQGERSDVENQPPLSEVVFGWVWEYISARDIGGADERRHVGT